MPLLLLPWVCLLWGLSWPFCVHVLVLPQHLLHRDMVEQLLQSQRDQEQSELGCVCHLLGTLGEGASPQEVLVALLVTAARPGV